MPPNKWSKCPATTNAVERKNKDPKGSLRIDLKEALVRVYRIDKAFCLQYIFAEERVRIRCRDSSHEVQAAAKRKQCCNKQYPKDTEALHGPLDKESNFGKDKATKKTQTTNKLEKTKAAKRPLDDITNDDNDFQPKNQSLKRHKLIFSLQHVKYFMMIGYGMMVQFVGLNTVKQKVSGNTRFLFLMGRQLSSHLMIPR